MEVLNRYKTFRKSECKRNEGNFQEAQDREEEKNRRGKKAEESYRRTKNNWRDIPFEKEKAKAKSSPWKRCILVSIALLAIIVGILIWNNWKNNNFHSIPFEYIKNEDGTIKITDYIGTKKKIEIPKEIYGNLVTVIGERAFSHCDYLTNITISDGLTTIEDKAFAHCRNLKSISIPDSVAKIGSESFNHCESLKSISIPCNITTIEERTFSFCYNLTNITMPDSLTTIEYGAFIHCENLKNISIPDGVITIEDGAFAYCDKLRNVTIPNSVTTIGWHAFLNCDNLKKVNIPHDCTIDIGTFPNKTKITRY